MAGALENRPRAHVDLDQPEGGGRRGLGEHDAGKSVPANGWRGRRGDLHPELRDLRGDLGDLRGRLARRRERELPLVPVPRLQNRRVGRQLLLSQPQCPRAKRARWLGRGAGGAEVPPARDDGARRPSNQDGRERSRNGGGAPASGRGRRRRNCARNASSGCLVSVHVRVRYPRGDSVPKRASFDDVSEEQVERFRRDGFLVVEEGLVPMAAVELLRERFAALFDGDYATGIAPDEVNWKRGRDREDVTRQICNGWRADDLIAAQVLSERTGRIAARLGGYRGTRMLQDNCLWKPPGTKSLGMHQDGSYAGYLSPPEMITCWVALDETFAQGGTIEYVRGSHLWPRRRRTAAASTRPRTGSRRSTAPSPRALRPSACPWS